MSVRLTTLPNGLKVVTDDMPGLGSTAVGLWVDVGARHETPAQHGASHMLEHMAFKGTATRSAQAIAEEIEAVGGHLNAYTSREQTAYYARVLKEDVALGVDLLADILQNSVFEPAELEREREVIVQEIGEAQDTPDDLVFDLLQEVSYPGQALGRPILGTTETVRGFTREDLSGYMRANYGAPAAILAASGGIDHDALVALATEKFNRLGAVKPAAPEAARWQGGDMRETRDLEQVHIALALDGVAYDDPDLYTAQVFSTVLGGGMSSRLFQEVREKRGLCYSVFAFSSSYCDGGSVGVYAGTGEKEAAELLPVIAGEIEKLVTGAEEAETARARAQLKAGLLMGLEQPFARAEHLARQLLVFGRLIPPAELVAAIDRVDAAAVRRFAARIMSAGRPALAALGPVKKLETFDRFAGRFQSAA